MSFRIRNRINELYGRRKQVYELENYIKRRDSPVVLVHGSRWIGKSSLVLSTLNDLVRNKENQVNYVYLKMKEFGSSNRKIEYNRPIKYKDFISVLNYKVNEQVKKRGLGKITESLKEHTKVKINPKVLPMEAEFTFKNKNGKLDLFSVLEDLDKWGRKKHRKVIVSIDDAERLNNIKDRDILEEFSNASEQLRNVSFIFTGSEAGINKVFLDDTSPLINIEEIQLEPLEEKYAIRYIEDSLEEQGFRVNEKRARRVFEQLGGNPGILTRFSINMIDTRNTDIAIKKTLKDVSKELTNELAEFISLNSSKMDKETASNKLKKMLSSSGEIYSLDDIPHIISKIEGKRIDEREEEILSRILKGYGNRNLLRMLIDNLH